MASSHIVSNQTLRIIDANLNRIGEGLRLLEDMARLLLDNAPLTKQLKAMRHQLEVGDLSLKKQLLQARNAGGDVGSNIEVPEQPKERDLPATVIANTRRVQQSLRVIEEMAKIPGISLETERFKKARFDLYTIEWELISRLLRKDKVERISGLYAVIDTGFLKGISHSDMASQLIKGGAGIIQLRDKTTPKGELLPIALELKSLCAERNVLFIVNDYLDIALAADADGLHIGQEDLPLASARRLLPIDKIIGCSVTTADQATAAEAEGADYIAVSGIYPTTSKEAVEVVGLEILRLIKRKVKLPVVAIGGINLDNIAEVMAAGASSVAVISALLAAKSPGKAARQMVDIIERQR
jgi:thiamine-phosphate pyrophosphorylase